MRTVIFTFIISILLLCGCGNRNVVSTDARLCAAEELLATYPDSALALLSSIEVDSIQGKADYAHYALLRTQAQYEVNNKIVDEALLDVALDYYNDNHDEEKFTRALIYKGLIAENYGKAALAMEYYCRALNNTDTISYETAEISINRNACLSIVREEMNKIKDRGKAKEKQILLLKIILCLSVVGLSAKMVRMRLNARRNLELIKLLQTEKECVRYELMQQLEHETKLKNVLSNQIENIRNLIDLSYRYNGNPTLFMKHFREKVKINKLPDGFWKDLRFFIDSHYANVITKLESQYPSLTEDELYLIGLMCLGFSYTEIAICMGYSNVYSANTKRARIAKKMGLTIPLKDYIDALVRQE